jgi:transcriptional regulator with XRE-family HTH domain
MEIAGRTLPMRNALDRLRRLVGSQARVARALDLTEKQVSRISTGKSPVPPYMEALAELLEALPPKDWPERWKT